MSAAPLPRSRVVLVLAASVVVSHGLVTLALPDVRSHDSAAWETVAALLKANQNPYATTEFVSWPPFWMQIVGGLGWVADTTGASFNLVLKVFLAAVEVVAAVALYGVIQRHFPTRRALAVVLIGFTLNPVVVMVQTLHGNFDILVALWVILFLGTMLDHKASDDPVLHLLACFYVGLGILTKTVPVVLVPLLLPGFLAAGRRHRTLAVALVLGPAVLASSVVFALDAGSAAERILRYDSTPGFFGITGLLDAMGADAASRAFADQFRWVLAAVLGAFTVFVVRHGVPLRDDLTRCVACLMALIPVWGSGYGPQYLLWFLPVLVLLHLSGTTLERRLLIAAFVTATLTCIVEYAVIPSHGAFALTSHSAGWLHALSERVSTPAGATLLRLPLFAVLVALTVAMAARYVGSARSAQLQADEEHRGT